MIAFTDAVVAIALTLLVLPLADVAGDLHDGTTLNQLWNNHWQQFISFVISFAVIWLQWRQHHRLMENFEAYDRVLVELQFVWLFTIVLLPFATALISGADVEWANVFYIAILMVSVGALVAMTRWGLRHPELIDDDVDTRRWAAHPGGYGTILMLLVALIITIIAPKSGNAPLLALLFSGQVESIGDRWLQRRRDAGK